VATATAAAATATTTTTASTTMATTTVTSTSTMTAAATALTTAATATIAATTMLPLAPASTTITATPTREAVTIQAAATTAITPYTNLVDDNNPFLVTSSIHLSEGLPANQLDVDVDNMSSEVSMVHQKSCKDAQDVKVFFQHENEQWYCKFCEYVFYLSMTLAFLTFSS
jgi:hypothetical protein